MLCAARRCRPYFRLDRVTSSAEFAAGLAIIIALEDGVLTHASGDSRELATGSTVLVPYDAGDYRVDGGALVARPPA